MTDIYEDVSQVDDDETLLSSMMSFVLEGDPMYAPTNYWSYYSKYFMPELTKRGLKDFRRRRDSILRSFGATDLFPYAEIRNADSPMLKGRPPTDKGKLGKVLTKIVEAIPGVRLSIDGLSPQEFVEYTIWRATPYFERKGLNIHKSRSTLIGNPEGIRHVDGMKWTYQQAQYCLTFGIAMQNVDVPEQGVFCDLGAGMGRQVEIVAAQYPEMTCLAFDIPPQLYVCNQFLKKRFPDRVVEFKDAINLDISGKTEVPEELRGKIIVLPPNKMPEWANIKVDLFWNSACFQEMEPDIVRNYLNLVKQMRTEIIYINALPSGNYWGNGKKDVVARKSRLKMRYSGQNLLRRMI